MTTELTTTTTSQDAPMPVPDLHLELEEYVSAHYYFFKRSNFTLDDLHVYAEPFADVLRAAYDLSERTITDREAFNIMLRSRDSLQAIHQRMADEAAADEAAFAAAA